MFLYDAALRIDNERSGERRNSAVRSPQFIRRHPNAIVDAGFLREFLHKNWIVVVGGKGNDGELIFVFFLKVDEVGNFRTARPTPGRPEIQQNYFPLEFVERNWFAVEVVDAKCGSWVGILDETDQVVDFFLLRRRWGGPLLRVSMSTVAARRECCGSDEWQRGLEGAKCHLFCHPIM